jgi:hypothetical protein
MRTAALALAALVLLSGCLGDGGGRPADDPVPAGDLRLEAPWWAVGESWTVTFRKAGGESRTVTLVNFANNTFGDPEHFWLGVTDREQALSHVFFDDNPFLGRIHWVLLAPHEKGMHSAMYQWPLEDGKRWTSPLLLGKEELSVQARVEEGRFVVEGEALKDGARFEYDYDPALRWFRHLTITEEDGSLHLDATVTDHRESGAKGTYYFLRGRDYLDSAGGTTGKEETFTVKEEGATSVAFLLDVQTSGPSALEFIDPNGAVVHRETLALGGTADKVVEISKHPAAGTWKLRYVGNVQGMVKVRGVIEYKATL